MICPIMFIARLLGLGGLTIAAFLAFCLAPAFVAFWRTFKRETLDLGGDVKTAFKKIKNGESFL